MNQLVNEGQLIEELVNPYWDEDEHVCPTTIKHVLDEAKKEFTDNLKNISMDFKVNQSAYRSEATRLTLDWFVKWFGNGS